MKIAFFVNAFPVLSQSFILNQITGLIDRGHDVDIYAYKLRSDPVVHADVEKYGLMAKTFCHGRTLPENKLRRAAGAAGILLKNPPSLFRLFNSLGPGRRGAGSLGLIHKANLFSAVREKYDILHCHFGPNGNLAARLRFVGAVNGALVTTFHGFDVSKYLQKNGSRVYDFLFREGDLFLPISRDMQKRLIGLGCDPGKIAVHRMGIDVSRFAPGTQQRGDRMRILTVGRLVEKKGIGYGIRGIARLARRFPHIEYRIVGDGPLRGDLEELIAELGLGDRVEILGWRSQEEVRTLMKRADIFLAPSVTDRNGDQEGLPVVLMEAMASGLPVVSTLHSAIPELVEDGISGFLVPERDAEALAAGLQCLLEHPESIGSMGAAGRAKVEREFDIGKLNDNLVALYTKLLRKRGGVPVADGTARTPMGEQGDSGREKSAWLR